MKTAIPVCVMALFAIAVSLLPAQSPSAASTTAQTTFVGRISDARYGTRVVPAQAAERGIAAGDQAALVEQGTDKVYIIANPSAVTAYVGELVTVNGTLDGKTLTVSTICHLSENGC